MIGGTTFPSLDSMSADQLATVIQSRGSQPGSPTTSNPEASLIKQTLQERGALPTPPPRSVSDPQGDAQAKLLDPNFVKQAVANGTYDQTNQQAGDVSSWKGTPTASGAAQSAIGGVLSAGLGFDHEVFRIAGGAAQLMGAQKAGQYLKNTGDEVFGQPQQQLNNMPGQNATMNNVANSVGGMLPYAPMGGAISDSLGMAKGSIAAWGANKVGQYSLPMAVAGAASTPGNAPWSQTAANTLGGAVAGPIIGGGLELAGKAIGSTVGSVFNAITKPGAREAQAASTQSVAALKGMVGAKDPNLVENVNKTAQGILNEAESTLDNKMQSMFAQANQVKIPPNSISNLRANPSTDKAISDVEKAWSDRLQSDPKDLGQNFINGLPKDQLQYWHNMKISLGQMGKSAANSTGTPAEVAANNLNSKFYSQASSEVNKMLDNASPNLYTPAKAMFGDAMSTEQELGKTATGKLAQASASNIGGAAKVLTDPKMLEANPELVTKNLSDMATKSPATVGSLLRYQVETKMNQAGLAETQDPFLFAKTTFGDQGMMNVINTVKNLPGMEDFNQKMTFLQGAYTHIQQEMQLNNSGMQKMPEFLRKYFGNMFDKNSIESFNNKINEYVNSPNTTEQFKDIYNNNKLDADDKTKALFQSIRSLSGAGIMKSIVDWENPPKQSQQGNK